MAKDKQNSRKSVPNKHLHARTTFLYQAATYLTLQAGANASQTVDSEIVVGQHTEESRLKPSKAALQLGLHLRGVSSKGQVHLSADLKRSICKTCNAILIPSRTSTHVLLNESKGGRKPWADALEVHCNICGSKKRFPVGANRQQNKSERGAKAKDDKKLRGEDSANIELSTTPPVPTNPSQSPGSG